MRWSQSLPALLAGLALLGTAPARAQQVKLVAAPVANATVHRIGDADLKDAVCTGKTDVAVPVPADEWVEVSLGWFAIDEATAKANWKSMAYTISLGDKTVDVRNLKWVTSRVHFDCPAQSYVGFAQGPVVYVSPSAAEQTVRVDYAFKNDVFDGWSTFKKDSKLTMTLRLQPTAAAAKAAPPPGAKQPEAKPSLELPQLTDEQRWSRLQTNWVFWVLAAGAQAKALGKSPEDFGHFAGRLFAPGWGATLTPAGLIRGWYLNASMFKPQKFQVLEVTDTLAKARANLGWVAALGAAQDVGGATAADLERIIDVTYQEIADAHGLKYEQVRDGDDLIITVRRK